MTQAHILVVDDEQEIRQLVREILEDEGYQVTVAENGEEARDAWRHHRPDLVLLDIWMPDIDGISLLKEWQVEQTGDCPVIMMSGHGTVETAVEATRMGAFDFLEKPLSLGKLLLTVERALESAKSLKQDASLYQVIDMWIEPVGKSAAIQRLKEQIRRLAQHDARVLLVGEPGSGKEVFARFLHRQSARRGGPFVELAMGGITPETSAVELFGREDAGEINPGLLEQAAGGTLFLENAAEMDDETQLRLVSAIESRFFVRVGGTQPVRLDARIITASRFPLEEEVRSGRFRRELYYLLNAVTLRIPPLREHSEDVPELLRYFTDYFVETQRLVFRKFPVAVQNYLRNHGWPGNVRELKNLVQRVLILGAGDEVSLEEVKHIIESVQQPKTEVFDLPDFFDLPIKEAREQFERAYLEYHLQHSGGNIAKLSQAVGMERTHLYRKLNALGINFREKR